MATIPTKNKEKLESTNATKNLKTEIKTTEKDTILPKNKKEKTAIISPIANKKTVAIKY